MYENVNTAYRMRDGRFNSNTVRFVREEKKLRANIIKHVRRGEKPFYTLDSCRDVSVGRLDISAGKIVYAHFEHIRRIFDWRVKCFVIAVNGHNRFSKVERK